MRILIFLADPIPEPEQVSWADEYSGVLRELGHEVERFDPVASRVARFDWVHVLGSVEEETWQSLSEAGPRVAVIPSLEDRSAGRRGAFVALAQAALRLPRALAQRRWPPRDERAFRRCAQVYLVPGPSWATKVSKEWRVPPARISRIPLEPGQAARFVSEKFSTSG